MDQIRITGGVALQGDITISGAKNAALPLMASCLLTDKPLTLSNVPHLADITTMASLLVHLGVLLTVDGTTGDNGEKGRTLMLTASGAISTLAPYDIVRKMRASVVVLGPLLARFGEAKVSLPGGCAIGLRPINYHLDAFAQMGASISLEDGYVLAKAPSEGLYGADITFPSVSVGATENVLMAATLANGVTTLRNAAMEPEINDLIDCLCAMGAQISGRGSDALVVTGVDSLTAADHSVLPDRIEAGTYAIAAAITGGKLVLHKAPVQEMGSTLQALQDAGVVCDYNEEQKTLSVYQSGAIKAVNIITRPHPDFPTDMQAQFTALMCLSDGECSVTETIFENRFMHIPELQRMGTDIAIDGKTITVTGVPKLHSAEVMATDLRASVSLVLAALAAEGETIINRVYHIDRGYERIEEKLRACGAKIERVRAAL